MIAVFGAAVNHLMPTGPIFMLRIHDAVRTSCSEATPVTVAATVAVPFLAMGHLGHARARVT